MIDFSVSNPSNVVANDFQSRVGDVSLSVKLLLTIDAAFYFA